MQSQPQPDQQTHRLDLSPLVKASLWLVIASGLAACSPAEPASTDPGPSAVGDAPTPPPLESSPVSTAPLDLTIDSDALWEADQKRNEIDLSDRQDLPDLVGADRDKRLTVDGRVITTAEEVARMRDRVDGAEVSIELKTD